MINTDLLGFGPIVYIGIITIIVAMVLKKSNNNEKV